MESQIAEQKQTVQSTRLAEPSFASNSGALCGQFPPVNRVASAVRTQLPMCGVCGIKRVASKRCKSCSNECRKEAARQNHPQIKCERCGTLFRVPRNRQCTAHFCSTPCTKYPRPFCRECGIREVRKLTSLYCSNACRSAASRKTDEHKRAVINAITRRSRARLDDAYIRQRLAKGLGSGIQFPPEIVELKRNHLRALRLLMKAKER